MDCLLLHVVEESLSDQLVMEFYRENGSRSERVFALTARISSERLRY